LIKGGRVGGENGNIMEGLQKIQQMRKFWRETVMMVAYYS
jgi:hypothetical protein